MAARNAPASPSSAVDPRVLGVVLVGGAAGGLMRYGVTEHWSTARNGVPWSIFAVNTAGAFAIGVLLVVLARRFAHRRLARPLLATGVLGGLTTFSSVVTDADRLIAAGRAGTAALYLAVSVASALAAVAAGTFAARVLVVEGSRPAGERP